MVLRENYIMSNCNADVNTKVVMTMKHSQCDRFLEGSKKKNATVPGKLSCMKLEIHVDWQQDNSLFF